MISCTLFHNHTSIQLIHQLINPNLKEFHACIIDYMQETKHLQFSIQEYQQNGRTLSQCIIGDYVVYEELGRGQFGTVYRGMHDTTKKQVAIKVIELFRIDEQPLSIKQKEWKKRYAHAEAMLMQKIDSRHVTKIYETIENEGLKVLVMQFCNEGTLTDEIMRKRWVSESKAIEIMKQVLHGVAAMHSNNIIHRDIKTDNILKSNGIYKLADLGFSKEIEQGVGKHTLLGTFSSMAPEILNREKYGLKADIWSVGTVFYKMIYGTAPYQVKNATPQIFYQHILKTDIFPNDGLVNKIKPSQGVIELLRKMLTIDQYYRIGWEALISHPIFEDSEKLPEHDVHRISIKSIGNPKVIERKDQELPDFLKNLGFEPKAKSEVSVMRMSYEQSRSKREQVDTLESELMNIARENHLQCLKTEVCLHKLIIPLESRKMLNLKERKNIEFIYLLTARCFINMSFVNKKIIENKHEFPIMENLKIMVENLYSEVEKKFKTYSEMLTTEENKLKIMTSDFLTRLFNRKEKEKKDIILSGNENLDFQKDEQIMYTEKYIPEICKAIKPQDIEMLQLLRNYCQINLITLQDLDSEGISFNDRMRSIVS